ncbi:hypothetical protein GCM10009799_00860 [Nocardiopsis rhodophaea]|uniref:Uncharacterized protein n=1 Tax=Nocardiopsis rhodophaea TaxID=280238 RepID=A0ABN2S3V3_9ACTN
MFRSVGCVLSPVLALKGGFMPNRTIDPRTYLELSQEGEGAQKFYEVVERPRGQVPVGAERLRALGVDSPV